MSPSRRRLLRTAGVRLLSSLGVLWAAVTIVFVLSRASGDPVALLLPEDADATQIAQMQATLGLDRPLIIQYLDYLGGLLRLDLGESLLYKEPVTSLILERLPATGLLALSALLITVVAAFLAGSVAALRRGSAVDRLVMGAVLVGQSTPAFWVGILLVLLFGVQLQVLPAAGYGTLAHLVLPAVTLAIFSVAVVARLLRSSLVEVMGQDHVRTARAKGAGELRVLLGHGLRNASLPVITVLGLELGALLGGAILTEQIFNWPGIGRLTIDAISFRDFPLVQGTVVLFAVTFVVVNLLVDLSYAVIDPRVRSEA
ncbi:ABC transporter permease [Brachybacterium sacelli]|uniref:Peptide/nickel transport system permease protein n=1 Tax=Brachybacterium sacelli TaxID=173364 RepID=A0ABS4WYV2_9MICO|nr:ABC transporter permease [Brachybacterium sacelli]MBP2381318.1 peptide/nickel transport system permease protein [Brachybacterium sacelli]